MSTAPANAHTASTPTGSAMPLVWAHAEHIKLLRSLRDGAVFDMPPQGTKRYVEGKTPSTLRSWRFNNKVRSMPAGKALRIEVLAPAMVHWSSDGWATSYNSHTAENAFGVHWVDLPTDGLPAAAAVVFTFCWLADARWENVDFRVEIEG